MSNNEERNEPTLVLEEDKGSIFDDAIKTETANEDEKPNRNPIKIFFAPENKTYRYGVFALIGLILLLFGFLAFKFSEKKEQRPQQPPIQQSVERVLSMEKLTPAATSEIEKYNQETVGGLNQPIPNDINKASGDGLEMEPETKPVCDEADTACMRINKIIGERECAPADTACQSEKLNRQETSSQKKKKSNYEDRLGDKEYMDKLANLVGEEKIIPKPAEGGFNIQFQEEAESDKKQEGGILAGQKPSVLQKANEAPPVKIATAGDIEMAVSDIALNSKIQGPVKLTILSGKYVNSVMIGNAEHVDLYMRLRLNKWVLEDKRECAIDAIALDRRTTYAAVASDVDHHILYRYGWWGAGTILGAMGRAAEKNADKQVVVTQGGVAISEEQSDSKREIKMALGELGTGIGEQFKDRINTPPTVTVDINEEMGVFFMNSVIESTCK